MKIKMKIKNENKIVNKNKNENKNDESKRVKSERISKNVIIVIQKVLYKKYLFLKLETNSKNKIFK